MNTKLIGAAVGAALENRETLQNMSAPVRNAAGGAAKTVFNSIWKTLAVNGAILIIWLAAFMASYVITGSPALGKADFMTFLAILMFLIVPPVVFIRETRKQSKAVTAKNRASREAAARSRAEAEARNAQAIEAWNIAQQQEAQTQQFNTVPVTQTAPTQSMDPVSA